MEENPEEFFDELTAEMIESLKKEVLPRIKLSYQIDSKEEYEELNTDGEIDNVDMFQVMEGCFDADEVLGISKKDFEDEDDYDERREELWDEKFYISEEQLKINLGIEYVLFELDW
jgi:hypothetical protein